MSQHDMNIGNQTFPATRADINAAITALASSNSAATAPTVTFPGMWWFDVANNLIRIRNVGNTGWVTVIDLSDTGQGTATTGAVKLPDGTQQIPALRFTNDPDTGLYWLGDGTLGVSCNGQVTGGGLALRITRAQVQAIGEFLGAAYKLAANGQFLGRSGDTKTLPSFSWEGDPKTGMYRIAAGRIGFSANDVLALEAGPSLVLSYAPLRAPAGDGNNLGFSIGSGNTGVYRDGNNLVVVVNGNPLLQLSPNFITSLSGKAFAGDGSQLTALSVDAVAAAIAGQGAGMRGSYALLGRKSGNSGFVANTVYDGALLGFAGINAAGLAVSTQTPSGSWRAMSNVLTTGANPIALFLRV